MTLRAASQSAILRAVGGVVGGTVSGAFLVGITAVVLVVLVKKRKKRDTNRAGKGRIDRWRTHLYLNCLTYSVNLINMHECT